jgi:anaerobic selenocysteine-containing dehydrogenase
MGFSPWFKAWRERSIRLTAGRTSKSDVLKKLYPKECYVEVNTEDARRLQIRSNSFVAVISRRAEIRASAL